MARGFVLSDGTVENLAIWIGYYRYFPSATTTVNPLEVQPQSS
jgi:hypothetical protein